MNKFSIPLIAACLVGCLAGCTTVDVDAKLRADGTATVCVQANPSDFAVPGNLTYEDREGAKVFHFTDLDALAAASGSDVEIAGDTYRITLPTLSFTEQASLRFQLPWDITDISAPGAYVTRVGTKEFTLEYSEPLTSPTQVAVSVDKYVSPFFRLREYRGQFTDVDANAWYRQSMVSVYELGMIEGTSPTTFSPNKQVTIAELVTLAARLHSIHLHDGHDFAPVEGGKWYAPYVDYAIAKDIIPSTFGRYEQVATRSELAFIFSSCLPEEMYTFVHDQETFADINSVDSPYYTSIVKLFRAGILNGTSSSTFSPFANTTRAQVVTIVARLALPDQRV